MKVLASFSNVDIVHTSLWTLISVVSPVGLLIFSTSVILKI